MTMCIASSCSVPCGSPDCEALDPPARRIGRLARDPGGRERDGVHPGRRARRGCRRTPDGRGRRRPGRPGSASRARRSRSTSRRPRSSPARGARRRSGRWSRGTPRASRPRAGRTGARSGRPRPGGDGRPGSPGGPCGPPGREPAFPGPPEPRPRRAGPTQEMRPSRTATASATVDAVSAVKTLPPVRTRSAGSVTRGCRLRGARPPLLPASAAPGRPFDIPELRSGSAG